MKAVIGFMVLLAAVVLYFVFSAGVAATNAIGRVGTLGN